MILDSNLIFDPPGTAITAGTEESTNVIDLGNPSGYSPGDFGVPGVQPLNLLVVTNGNFAGGTSVNIQIQGAPDNGSGSPGTYVTLSESGAITTAQLNANGPGTTVAKMPLPRTTPGVAPVRFLRLAYVVSGTYTGGTLQSFLAAGVEAMNYYAAGTVVNN